MGSPADFAAMLDLVNGKAIHPTVSHAFPLDQVGAAFDLLQAGTQFGKVVVTL
ncbi:MAG: zinc-binding dehydrogenase [Verrucomicrobiota bacterium]